MSHLSDRLGNEKWGAAFTVARASGSSEQAGVGLSGLGVGARGAVVRGLGSAV